MAEREGDDGACEMGPPPSSDRSHDSSARVCAPTAAADLGAAPRLGAAERLRAGRSVSRTALPISSVHGDVHSSGVTYTSSGASPLSACQLDAYWLGYHALAPMVAQLAQAHACRPAISQPQRTPRDDESSASTALSSDTVPHGLAYAGAEGEPRAAGTAAEPLPTAAAVEAAGEKRRRCAEAGGADGQPLGGTDPRAAHAAGCAHFVSEEGAAALEPPAELQGSAALAAGAAVVVC